MQPNMPAPPCLGAPLSRPGLPAAIRLAVSLFSLFAMSCVAAQAAQDLAAHVTITTGTPVLATGVPFRTVW
jgi:hypothetical protein